MAVAATPSRSPATSQDGVSPQLQPAVLLGVREDALVRESARDRLVGIDLRNTQ